MPDGMSEDVPNRTPERRSKSHKACQIELRAPDCPVPPPDLNSKEEEEEKTILIYVDIFR